MSEEAPASVSKKNYNLLILGVVAVAIALITTAISVLVYHYSGDIYLDRSRPGFLPDEKEVEDERKEDYAFSENDELTNENLEEFLTNFKETLDDLDKVNEPFSEKPLSDESLDISSEKTE